MRAFSVICVVIFLMDISDIHASSASTTTRGNGASLGVVHYAKCNPSVVTQIYKIWKKEHGGWPTKYIERASAVGKELVVITTGGYYKNLTCLYSLFYKDSFTGVSVQSDGSCFPKVVPVIECEGRLITHQENGVVVYRYIITSKNGVTTVYTCVECGVNPSASVKLDGLIKISEKEYKKNPHQVEKELASAKKLMKDLGFELSDVYPKKCACKEPCVE